MKVILSKEDIEMIIKEYFDMESVAWQKDGTIVIDTTLEKITNEKNTLDKFNDKLGINKKNVPYLSPARNYVPSWNTGRGITSTTSNIGTYLTKTPVKI